MITKKNTLMASLVTQPEESCCVMHDSVVTLEQLICQMDTHVANPVKLHESHRKDSYQ